MEMISGYKNTDIGLVPTDWDVVPLSYLLELRNGVNADKGAYGHGIPFINVLEVLTKSHLRASDIPGRVALNRRVLEPYVVRFGDILFNRTSETQEDVGLAAVYCDSEPVVFGGFVIRGRPKNERLDPMFAGYGLRSQTIRNQLTAMGQGAIRANIGQGELGKVLVPVPPLLEQRAIAVALGEVDALLAELETLIAKKRALGHVVLQDLLTGKRRLPGYVGRWISTDLRELGEISGSGVDKKIRANETAVRLVNYLDVYHRTFITTKDLHHTVTAPTSQAARCTVRKGDVFFTPSSETRNDIARSAVALEDIPDAAYSYHVVRLRIRTGWDLRFRAYAFQNRNFLAQAETLCDGSGTRYVLSLEKFRGLNVTVPPVEEQAAIASVLSDIDAEIEALEVRLQKTRLLKQGMMQELLTGRIRLK